jgi:phosphate transport system substrate-binding protein
MIRSDKATRLAWLPVASALFAWLCIVPAAAQQASVPAPPNLPTANITERPELFIVGSSTMKRYVDLTIESMHRLYHLPPPKLELQGAAKGIAEFCDGVGAEYPDIVVSSRGMHKDEFDDCIQNGVLDIIEIRIGQGALFVVTDKGDAVFNVTPRMLYYALAAQLPKDGGFDDNPNKTWRQTDKSAPDLPIGVILPDRSSGTRNSFDAMFMQGGCRRIKDIDFIYSAAERTEKCTTLRTDGVVTEVAEPYGPKMVELLLKSPAGTIAVMAGEIYTPVRDQLDVLPVNGALPTDEAVNRFEYLMASGNYVYFKRAHMRNKAGVGVVMGIREFMAELTRDELIGRDGAFSKIGLIAPSEREIQAEQRKVRTLKRFTR